MTFYQIKEVQANVKTSNNDDKINLIVLFNEDDIDGEVENFIESSGGVYEPGKNAVSLCAAVGLRAAVYFSLHHCGWDFRGPRRGRDGAGSRQHHSALYSDSFSSSMTSVPFSLIFWTRQMTGSCGSSRVIAQNA